MHGPGVHPLAPNVHLHVFEAEAPGPTLLFEAGIHGDEVAGVHALEELIEEGLTPRRGRLLVCPVMNPGAYRARQRMAHARGLYAGLDLNRCYPGDAASSDYERRLARIFMDLVLEERPALVCTLHESHKRYDPSVTPSFGQSLVYGVEPMPEVLARVVDRLNANLESEDERWATNYFPVPTSSTEVIVAATGCVGVCVETWMGFPEARRVDMQKEVVRLFQSELG